jgi:hypothetical protein
VDAVIMDEGAVAVVGSMPVTRPSFCGASMR